MYDQETIGQGTFYTGDCFEVMRDLPDGSVDMVLCDLPYGTTQNKWDSVLPFDDLWSEYLRLCKPNAILALTASQPFSSALVMSNMKLFKHEWVWIKNRGSNFANTVREPMKEHESVLVFSKGKWTYNKQMQERTGGGVAAAGKQNSRGGFCSPRNYGAGNTERMTAVLPKLRVPSSWQKFNCEVGIHPNQKPVALFEYLIRTYTDEDMVVLDNTAGSGTTAVAAENAGRRWICIERES
jgi:site-specific DNA-methyltransferase (adenine-specific)